jgi:hypothetical protein
MEIKKELITPEIAKKLLEKNDHNRRLKMPVVFRYSNDMKEGRWKDNTAELIKVSVNGKLLDGQHRLKAIVISNTSQFFWVAYNLQEEIFDVLDTGSPRSTADVFKISDIKNDTAVSAIISHYNVFQKTLNKNVQKHSRPTNAEILAQYNQDPEFWQFIYRKSDMWYQSFSKIITRTTIGSLYTIFYKINPEQANDFMDQLCKGSNIKNPTIELLRKRLIQDRLSNAKISPTFKNVLIVKVWNLYRKNESVKVLKFDFEKEEFPRPL